MVSRVPDPFIDTQEAAPPNPSLERTRKSAPLSSVTFCDTKSLQEVSSEMRGPPVPPGESRSLNEERPGQCAEACRSRGARNRERVEPTGSLSFAPRNVLAWTITS